MVRIGAVAEPCRRFVPIVSWDVPLEKDMIVSPNPTIVDVSDGEFSIRCEPRTGKLQANSRMV